MHLGQSWQLWPLKGHSAQNSDAMRGKDFPTAKGMKQEFVGGSEAAPSSQTYSYPCLVLTCTPPHAIPQHLTWVQCAIH